MKFYFVFLIWRDVLWHRMPPPRFLVPLHLVYRAPVRKDFTCRSKISGRQKYPAARRPRRNNRKKSDGAKMRARCSAARGMHRLGVSDPRGVVLPEKRHKNTHPRRAAETACRGCVFFFMERKQRENPQQKRLHGSAYGRPGALTDAFPHGHPVWHCSGCGSETDDPDRKGFILRETSVAR